MYQDNYLPADITTTPITNPVEITAIMEADAAKDDKPTNPGPEQHPQADQAIALTDALVALITPLIERMVEKKFAALVQNHNTLSHMDESLIDKMWEVANTAVENHEQDKAHPEEDDVTSRVEDTIETYLRRNHGFVTEDKVNDIVSEAIEQHEYDTNHMAEHEIDDKLENFISTDNIEEYVVEALKVVEFKINVTEKE